MIGRRHPLARFALLLPALCLLLLGGVIFREFLFGGQVLLYKDIGSDSLNDYYPWFVHFSDYIRREGFPSWSFHVGMGQDIFYLSGYLIWQPVVWLSRDLIAYALVYQHLGKVLLTGLLFFRFLQVRGLKLPASLLGSLLLAFSAYMCMGSCWFTLADEVVASTAILLATEDALQNGRWFFLSLAVSFVSLQGSFYLYLSALFLLCYVPARLLARYGWQPRWVLRACLILAGAAALGVGLAGLFTLPHLYAILNSPRGSGTTSAVAVLRAFPVFGLESHLHYITAVLRPLANDVLGTADDFRGWSNYLEAPLTYCGVICLLLLPQVFLGASRRHRIAYSLFLAAIILSTTLPWFRYLFWLFQGDYYRTHSLFSILAMIILSVMSFSRYIEKRPLSLWLLASTAIILAAIPWLPIEELQTHINSNLKQPIAIFLLLYGLVLAGGQLIQKQELAAWLVVGLAALELAFFDHITVSNRETVSKNELRAPVGYNDRTLDAVRDIKASDDERFFRITKLRSSGLSPWASLNDAMIFGYYGTSSYSSFNNVNYTNFLTAVEAIPANSESNTRWSIGLIGRALLSIFACEKYALVEDPAPFQATAQYEAVRRYGPDYLFRNNLFLPLGLTFDRYVPEALFLQLPAQEKPEVLFRAVVFAATERPDNQALPEVSITDLEQEMSPTALPRVVEARRKTALILNSFHQTRLEGTVRLDRKSVLVLQMPFDRGWRAYQDGKSVPTHKVDAGLMGVFLDPGEHQVKLDYATPFLLHGLAVSLASVTILLVSLWRWPRFYLPA